MKKQLIKTLAHTMLLAMSYQLVFPACAYALTTGPSQPEVQSFEPVGTTEMVDMFTGDFNYNIPLMDVEGYPINIFYHSGVGIEQEASWVGLGWNINPGEINRSVRGLPDDFNGEKIVRTTNILSERDVRVGIGGDVALELFGKNLKEWGLDLTLGGSLYVAHSNYRGLSTGLSRSIGISSPVGSVGVNLGIGTQSGADVDVFGSLKIPDILGKNTFGIGVNAGTGFNSRTGLKDLSLGAGVTTGNQNINKLGGALGLTSAATSIPVGMQNYVPVIANKMTQEGFQAQVKLGMSAMGLTASGYVEAMFSEAAYESDATRSGFGYLYLQNARGYDNMLDFSREKDGVYNKTLKNLPPSGLAYDLYTVNGHGTGGMFRAHRNDLGTIYDPYVSPDPVSKKISDQREVGIPGADYGEVGDDITTITTTNKSGPWENVGRKFSANILGSLFENVFFMQAGELTYNQQQEASQLFNNDAQYLSADDVSTLIGKYGKVGGSLVPELDGGIVIGRSNLIDRSSRATNISWQTAYQAMRVPELNASKKIVSYDEGANFYDPILTSYNRYPMGIGTGAAQNDNPNHISEFTQTSPDGRRYVYGLPALNNITKEVTMAVNEDLGSPESGYIEYNSEQNSTGNKEGRDHFYTASVTPAYAHSYLLTSLLSADYVDVLGDGPTDDDLGTYVKYNYSLKDNDYRWKTPYPDVPNGKNYAQYNPGYWSDKKDGKGNYILGSRQQWYVRSIETKNYIAEFYTSKRIDGRGVKEKVRADDAVLTDAPYSYKLDSIRLFNKHDRYVNKDNATPVKTVIFKYNYSLCQGSPNSFGPGVISGGKLTLERILIRYGNSDKNLLSPYVFQYNGRNPNYSFVSKDRWGNYKKSVTGILNTEFPYTDQPDNGTEIEEQNKDLASWNLTDIQLPSGGKIHIDYESDDYSFVQDKRSMQMLHIVGVGSSPKMVKQNILYTDGGVNDYVYFKRRKNLEIPGLSLMQNYLEGQAELYYSFDLDVNAMGTYESIKGYAKIEDVGYCDGATGEYGYIKLKREDVKGLALHPATFLGINTGKYYMPHLFYDGYTVDDPFEAWKSLVAKVPELMTTILGQNQFKQFIKKRKAQKLNIANCFIRVQTPGLTKKGGGIRVKKLVLSDNWNNLSGNEEATYGKQYDYTIADERYGKISSGVASYEPMVGADENPFRKPVPYSVDMGRGLPSTDFYQEEPFGESFFPSPSVGYSSVRVTSIHKHEGRSSQALDEYLFYTAKDYPVIVDYTDKYSEEENKRDFDGQFDEARVQQGYCIQMNDMHGKPKSVNNYVCYTKDGIIKNELITGTRYNYFENDRRQLDNRVKALVRVRGTQNTFEIRDVILGQDMDFTVDSRSRSCESTNHKSMYNVNVLQLWGVPAPVPTLFKPGKTSVQNFRSLVSTKIIQRYGIIRSIEKTDHGAKTITENIVFDAETGTPLLTTTNNEFAQRISSLTYPAYLAYEGMRPAYTNDGYEEISDSLVVNDERNGYLYTNNFDRFTDGDELLVTQGHKTFKLWVLGVGTDNTVKNTTSADPKGVVSFAKVRYNRFCSSAADKITVYILNSSNSIVASGTLKKDLIVPSSFHANTNAWTKELPPGTYKYVAVKTNKGSSGMVKSESYFTITDGAYVEIPFTGVCPDMGSVRITKKVCRTGPSSFCFDPDKIKLSYKLWQVGIPSVIFADGTLIRDFVDATAASEGRTGEVACISLPVGNYHLELNTSGSPDHGGSDHPIGYDFAVEKDKTVNYLYRCDACGEGILSAAVSGTCTPLPDVGKCDPSGPTDPGGSSVLAKMTGEASGGVDVDGVDRSESSDFKTARVVDVTTSEGTSAKRCALLVAPRYKDKFSGSTNQSTWPQERTTYRKAYVKVLRSGRRNNLASSVQQTSFGEISKVPAKVDEFFQVQSNVLSSSANTFTDVAQLYTPFTDEMDIPGDFKYGKFNPFVLGCRGTFRPLASFVPVAPRSYTYTSVQRDGAYNIGLVNQFWMVMNGAPVAPTVCDGPTDLLVEKPRTDKQFWKMASKVIRYDIFGNALEEQDAIGNYSSAQYGYNKSLPVSVASNARYQQFMFEGFEDYKMMLPQKIGQLFLKGDLYSALGILFGGSKPSSLFSFSGQSYYLKDMAPTGSDLTLTDEASHSGYLSMKSAAAATVSFAVGNALPDKIGKFSLTPGKYLVQLWAKHPSTPITAGMYKVTPPGSSSTDLTIKAPNIDGWYLLEAPIEITVASLGLASPQLVMNIPSGAYTDDIRIMPLTANMKSFVYDPLSFKLMAQLDENHMATFFEYDQEGLLVRTKKETDRGIITISESRRANSKKNVAPAGSGGSGGTGGSGTGGGTGTGGSGS